VITAAAVAGCTPFCCMCLVSVVASVVVAIAAASVDAAAASVDAAAASVDVAVGAWLLLALGCCWLQSHRILQAPLAQPHGHATFLFRG